LARVFVKDKQLFTIKSHYHKTGQVNRTATNVSGCAFSCSSDFDADSKQV